MSRPEPAALLAPGLAQLRAYPVPPSAGLIKLDAMENPWPLPESLRAAWAERLAGVALNRYPDAGASALKERLSAAFPLPPGWTLMLGNGSDELILMLCLAVARPGARILAPGPSFVMYRHLAVACGLDYVEVPLREDFALDREAMLEAIAREQPALVFLAQPNNPTANLFDAGDLAAICEAAPGLVVIDEAYIPYAQSDATALATAHEHVLLLRTLSKWGLAGLRLGFLMGPKPWLGELEKLRLPYNISSLSQAGAEFALEHQEVFAAQVDAVRAERGRVAAELAAIEGLTVYPSATNFLLCRTPAGRARAVFEGLRDAGVLIKCLDGAHPLLADCLRPTIGRPDENDAMLAAWRAHAGR